jgi:anti-sigma regulatory factor (Ser/Thr protein kinase)
MDHVTYMARKPWDLTFLAEPEEVAALRRILRIHLGIWGLQHLTEDAQLCVSELVSNVITHVGPGTPSTLAVSMRGAYLRIEVHDPDTRALPTLVEADPDGEAGRGMALVTAVSDRWGVQLLADRKGCELGTRVSAPGIQPSPRIARAERLFHLHGVTVPEQAVGPSRLGAALAETLAVDAITDLLYWLRAHGHDADEALDRAQTRFEAELSESAGEAQCLSPSRDR